MNQLKGLLLLLLLALFTILLTTTCKKKTHHGPVDDYPSSIDEYVTTNYPDEYITEVELDDGEAYEVELCDGTELLFDLAGIFLEVEEEKEGNCGNSIALNNIDLSLTMRIEGEGMDSLIAVGDVFSYEIKLKNNGLGVATGVEVYTKPPKQVEWSGFASTQGIWSNGTGIWQVGTLKPQQEVSLLITIQIAEAGMIEFTSSVHKANEKDIDSIPNNNLPKEDDQALLLIDARPVADLSLEKTADVSKVAVGEQITYKITVTNDGPSDATGIVVIDVLPKGLSFIGSTGYYIPIYGTWTVGDMAAGTERTILITTLAEEVGTYNNIAQIGTVDQHDIDSTPSNGIPEEDDQDQIEIVITE